MKTALAVAMLALSTMAFSEEPSTGPLWEDAQQRPPYASRAYQETTREGYAPKKLPLWIKDIAPSADAAPNKQGHERENGSSENRTLETVSICVTAVATALLALFNFNLSDTTKKLWTEARTASGIADKSANAAIISAMPILSPFVTDGSELYPSALKAFWNVDAGTTTFDSKLRFTFENYGKTPGIVRDVRADMIITNRDAVPPIDYDALPRFRYEPIIPGDARKGRGVTSVMDHSKQFIMSRTEFDELHARAESVGDFRRMALVGRVIYEDFFGLRHTRFFCVKLKLTWEDRQVRVFQSIHGGGERNSVLRENVPQQSTRGGPNGAC